MKNLKGSDQREMQNQLAEHVLNICQYHCKLLPCGFQDFKDNFILGLAIGEVPFSSLYDSTSDFTSVRDQ